ncbi:MAG: TetR/AcrR family transcriptional regulator, partial [Gaiella sp.]
MRVTTRQTADERREAVLEAARPAFAAGGLHGTSTEDIAEAAGISQPYLFRLFGTKKKLFVANVERCMEETLQTFRD